MGTRRRCGGKRWAVWVGEKRVSVRVVGEVCFILPSSSFLSLYLCDLHLSLLPYTHLLAATAESIPVLVRSFTHVRQARDLFPGTDIAFQRPLVNIKHLSGPFEALLRTDGRLKTGALSSYHDIDTGVEPQPRHEIIDMHCRGNALCDHVSSANIKPRELSGDITRVEQ